MVVLLLVTMKPTNPPLGPWEMYVCPEERISGTFYYYFYFYFVLIMSFTEFLLPLTRAGRLFVRQLSRYNFPDKTI